MIYIGDVRCPKCNQLLLKADYVKGEIKCIRCKKIIELEINRRTEPRATP
ncbi:Com family DNA-binding transcriptional regulator [Clostridium sporogenes]|nr:Com family DNA-binding transcriptional regulator [Clostridium sporogenes]MCW6105659.1 Com family DNA-binding transcriptional regulator [Clostridium sporogenes]